ncbi:MAG: tetraacyldisaccharide 4'-kinase [Candidatus Omnitrophota bacterium]
MLRYIYELATDKHRGPVAGTLNSFLYLISLIYGLVVRILLFIYRIKPYRLGCKVISVGNITLGGTGKTSLVLYIARYLKEHGHKVAILSRGYKRMGSRFSVLGSRPNTEHRTPNAEAMGDEPYMLQMNLKDIPVIVDHDRIRAGNSAIRDYGADTVILDDGMQQWRIKKDLEIVAVDSTFPFGNRNLIPRGILREPLSSLKRADIFILTKANISPAQDEVKGYLRRINPGAFQVESAHAPLGFCRLDKPRELMGADMLAGKSAGLFSAIADPASFELLVSKQGVNIGTSFRFRDHYNYTQKDMDEIISKSTDTGISVLVTTEKDASRLYQLPVTGYKLPVWFLRIELKIIKNEEGFRSRLLGLFSH